MCKKLVCAFALLLFASSAYGAGFFIPQNSEMQEAVNAQLKAEQEKADKINQNLENINNRINNWVSKFKLPFKKSQVLGLTGDKTQDEMERDMVLIIQNMNGRTALKRKEKKKFLSIYQDMPMSYEEYEELSKDIKRNQREAARPLKSIDKKIVKVDDPRFIISKYNSPPGSRNLDLRNLRPKREINSMAVISPNKDKIAYTTIHYEGASDKIFSDLFCLKLDEGKSLKHAMKDTSVFKNEAQRLLSVGQEEEYAQLFRSLTIVDWSSDGNKLAIKERVGSTKYGIWQTNLWVYDFADNSSVMLVEVRDAIKYWWKTNKRVDIDDYMWDIIPMGWDEIFPDRVIVAAYGYTEKKSSKFLGLFSVDSKGKNTQFISDLLIPVNISTSGLILKPVLSDF